MASLIIDVVSVIEVATSFEYDFSEWTFVDTSPSAETVLSASLRTSWATTAKPFPASPALAASMAAFLLSSGEKGKRYCLENAEVMIHQPLGGAKGQATEIEIAAKQILATKQRLNRILSENTGKPIEIIAADTERDNWKTAEEAKEYGLIDAVITNRSAE